MTFSVAHRGLSGELPENTIQALLAAVGAGFGAVEIDVRLTADKEVVLLHDAGLERTTDGSGRVGSMTYDELRSYNTEAGPVPRLDDALSALSAWHGWWDIELKDSAAAPYVKDLLAHHGIGHRAHISSMDPAGLQGVGKSRGLIVLGEPDAHDLAEAKRVDAVWLHCDETVLGGKIVAELKKEGFQLGAWTVNDLDRAKELEEAGVQCIFTDMRAVGEAVREAARF